MIYGCGTRGSANKTHNPVVCHLQPQHHLQRQHRYNGHAQQRLDPSNGKEKPLLVSQQLVINYALFLRNCFLITKLFVGLTICLQQLKQDCPKTELFGPKTASHGFAIVS